MHTETFYSHGKLLLTGEYLVLDGAKALAIPCKFGQTLHATATQNLNSSWTSYDDKNQIWLNLEFKMHEVLSKMNIGKSEPEARLFEILLAIDQLNPEALKSNFDFETRLEFPKEWGLGSSSTLISNLAQWANVDAYQLLKLTFGGSGYDIACAMSASALCFQLVKNKQPKIESASFPDAIKPYTYFVHLGQKQNSRSAIIHYRANPPKDLNAIISKVDQLTHQFLQVSSLEEAQYILEQHENLLSKVLQMNTIKSSKFSDFDGAIKSLGAWGGDFIMVLSQHNPTSYFEKKGLETILSYQQMAL
ncbi:GYDIA family GHMP kinase [Psychroflexus tropicus]|uniref:GYDIA family GHMP kinase n=1 Tax=Psychroflexus tropicus TaxID=197345 RepID=UPI000367FD5C|nr:GYDIA family GHMP kinase [Psychroflexus tropicus]